ncbi:MAG: AI-2E family transporter [Candidatus Microbacterium phytovorans]|uniref:AI-2E family transporter n=1 Tax=Candidatus Microbacterium phytovorans TaxID=3121374 RepID=A0AAJ5W244_9MICO|nr:AI-2E family transporter [Microbacterium sp.]WEK13246.1 MAG: AI-2E family transporter [Microbacterium sp.]
MTDAPSEPGPSPRRWSRRRPSASPAAAADGAPPTDALLVPEQPVRSVGALIQRPFVLGFLVVLGGLLAVGLTSAIADLATIWIYIAFALFAALGLDPLVRRLERRGVGRAWGIVIVYFVFAIVMVGVLWLVIPTVVGQIAQFIRDLPSTIAGFQQTDFYLWARDQFGDQVPALLNEIQRFLSDPANLAAIGGGVLQIGVSIGTTISGIIIIIVLSLYFLASLPEVKQAFYRLVPARNRPLTAELTEEITASVGGYLGGMIILAFFNSLVTFLLYSVLGLPFPLLLAVVSFCITIIPLVGTVLFWGIGSVVALFTNPLSALVFAAAYLVYMQLEAYVLTPRVMNKTIAVPGSLVVIGALVGGTLMGLLGALVAIPVTASLLLVLKKVWIPRQDAKV